MGSQEAYSERRTQPPITPRSRRVTGPARFASPWNPCRFDSEAPMPSDLPTGRHLSPQEADIAIARLAAARSLLVIKRFAYKVGFFVLFAGGAAAFGQSFVKHLASFTLLSAIVSIVLAQSQRERVWAPYYTSFDEAAWFLLLSFILRAHA